MTQENETIEVRLERVFRAPIELVYEAFVDPERVVQWMKCEPGVQLRYDQWQPKLGERFRSRMTKPGAWEVETTGEFIEVNPPRVLAYRSDPNPPMKMPSMTVRVELEPVADGTRVVLTQTGVPKGMGPIIDGGWTGGFEQLEALLRERVRSLA